MPPPSPEKATCWWLKRMCDQKRQQKKEEKAYFDPHWYNLAGPMKLKSNKKKMLILTVVNTASHCY